jgi:hypothetical protein
MDFTSKSFLIADRSFSTSAGAPIPLKHDVGPALPKARAHARPTRPMHVRCHLGQVSHVDQRAADIAIAEVFDLGPVGVLAVDAESGAAIGLPHWAQGFS